MATEKHFRRWLDRTASVDSYIHVTTYVSHYTDRKTKEPTTTYSAELKLADCSRSVGIEFTSSSKKLAEAKLAVLEEALRFLRSTIDTW